MQHHYHTAGTKMLCFILWILQWFNRPMSNMCMWVSKESQTCMQCHEPWSLSPILSPNTGSRESDKPNFSLGSSPTRIGAKSTTLPRLLRSKHQLAHCFKFCQWLECPNDTLWLVQPNIPKLVCCSWTQQGICGFPTSILVQCHNLPRDE